MKYELKPNSADCLLTVDTNVHTCTSDQICHDHTLVQRLQCTGQIACGGSNLRLH